MDKILDQHEYIEKSHAMQGIDVAVCDYSDMLGEIKCGTGIKENVDFHTHALTKWKTECPVIINRSSKEKHYR